MTRLFLPKTRSALLGTFPARGIDWRRQQLPVAAEDLALVGVDLTALRARSWRRAAAGCVQTEKHQRRQGGMRSGPATTGRRG